MMDCSIFLGDFFIFYFHFGKQKERRIHQPGNYSDGDGRNRIASALLNS